MLDRLVARLRPRHHYESVIHDNLGGARLLATLITLLIAIIAVYAIAGRLDTMARAGTADVRIVHTRFQPRDPGLAQTPQGTQIEYTYSVDGVTYASAAFRLWTDVGAHHPKVCFEPAHPANHLLVGAATRCGIDAGP
jgi:hypothetical protein